MDTVVIHHVLYSVCVYKLQCAPPHQTSLQQTQLKTPKCKICKKFLIAVYVCV